MTTDKILDKLAKLKAAREGEAALGNQAAADAFAQMINSLLLKYELSEADVPLAPDADPIVERLVDLKANGIGATRVRVGWQECLASIVARAHLCTLLVHPGSNFVTFVGTKGHAAVAEYAYVVLVRSADAMSRRARDDYWREHRRDSDFESGNFRAAWLRGFIGRIAERFAEQREREVQEAASGVGTALMRLDQALVRAKGYVDDRYKGQKAAAVRVGSGCLEGQLEGRKAADRMDIGRRGMGQGVRKQVR